MRSMAQQHVAFSPRGDAIKLLESHADECLLEGPVGTGKSYALIWKAHLAALKRPNVRILFVRKTLVSLTGSAVATYTSKVLTTATYGVRFHGGSQASPPAFRYPNGSLIMLGGMDKPSKVMSTEYDMICCFEATELSLADWESLITRLRNGAMPYQQIIADCNPDQPSHWLNQRASETSFDRFFSRHPDNPNLWDAHVGDWTEFGRLYVMQRLERLTGVRRKRLLEGKWVAAEGQVYEGWDPAVHVLTTDHLVASGVFTPDLALNRDVVRDVVAGVDWGFTNPGVLLVFAIDGDGRMILIRQVMRTRETIDWWIEQGQEVGRLFGVSRFVCDPAEPGFIQQFHRAGLRSVAANNEILPGIDALQQRLAIADDGRPRFFVWDSAQQHMDAEIRETGQPWSIEQEFTAYVWARGTGGLRTRERPVDDANHGMDAARYVSADLDLRTYTRYR